MVDLRIYMLPAVLALLIKVVVLFLSHKSSKTSKIFFTMVMIFACHNVAELLGYVEFIQGMQLESLIRWYYVMSVCGLAAMLIYSIEICKLYSNPRNLNLAIVSLVTIVSLIVLFTDMIVAGSIPIGYSVTAEKGQYYWIFQLTSLTTYVGLLWNLIRGYSRAEDHITEIRCSYTLFALAPIMLVSLTLLGLMAVGITLNAALLMPIASSLFLIITLKAESKHGLTDVRRHIPYSLERKTSNEIMDIFSKYAQDEINYRDSMAELEKLLVTHKHDKHGGNVSTTAASMDIPRSSLYSIFRRLEIDHSSEK